MTVELPNRAALGGPGVEVLSRGGAGNADVLLVPMPGAPQGAVVVKDYAPRGVWMRRVLGPWLAARERRAIERLRGLSAVPRVLGVIDRLAFALEYRPGEMLTRALAPRLPHGYFEALERAVAEMHERGVVHLDLKHRSNVLVDAQGRPVLIDFASAVCFRPGSWLYRWYRPVLAGYDRDALEKWRVRLVPAQAAQERA